jgi:hypothetical protein
MIGLKDLDDKSKKDPELLEKLQRQAQSDEYKQKMRDYKQETSQYSLLHLAAKNNRTKICKFLIEEIKIGKY